MRYTPEYNVWCNMKRRCYSIKNDYYKDYGGRGITVCEEWRTSFKRFFEDMGTRPSAIHMIERKNNDLGYSADNCIWVLPKQQARNTRRNVWVTLNGVTKCVTDWALVLGIKQLTIGHRVYLARRNGVALDASLLREVRPAREPLTFDGRTQTLTAWARELGVHPTTLSYRLKKGTVEEALTKKR